MLKQLMKTLIFYIIFPLLYFVGEVNAQESAPIVINDSIVEKEKEQQNNDSHWINEFHETISDSVFQSAYWFDNFFTEEGSEHKSPTVNAKIRLEWRPKSRSFDEIKARFKVKVRLPHFRNKVDLILSDDDDSEQNQLPLETINLDQNAEEEKFSAALRYLHKSEKNKFTDARIGLSGGDIFVRSRHRRYIQWDNYHAFKIEPSIYYYLNDGLGSKLLLEYDHQHDAKTQYRINYSIRGSESFSGIRWKHGFYRLKHLSDSVASVTSLQVEGERNGARGFVVDNYTLSYRYRFNAYRKWLFFEIEPFLEWPENEGYKTTPGVALRVEGHFYKG